MSFQTQDETFLKPRNTYPSHYFWIPINLLVLKCLFLLAVLCKVHYESGRLHNNTNIVFSKEWLMNARIEKLTEYRLQSKFFCSSLIGQGSTKPLASKLLGNLQSTMSTALFKWVSADVKSNSMLTYNRLRACSIAFSRWLQFLGYLKQLFFIIVTRTILVESNNRLIVQNLTLCCKKFRINHWSVLI